MEKIASDVWKLNVDSNVYLIKDSIIIDTGPRAYHNDVKESLSNVIGLNKVKKVILTHIHYDHSGNTDLFPNAEIYASKREYDDFIKNPIVAFNLDPKIISLLKNNLKPIESIKDFLTKNKIKVINVPGHTGGSIALLYNNILFSGDCLFQNGIGRIDLPNSVPDEMENSLNILKNTKYNILAPGHDY